MANIPTETPPNPWKTFLSTGGLGILSIGLGIYLYFDLAKWEETGGTRVMNSLISAVYHTMGKGGVLGVCILLGIVLLAAGITDLLKQLKKRQK